MKMQMYQSIYSDTHRDKLVHSHASNIDSAFLEKGSLRECARARSYSDSEESQRQVIVVNIDAKYALAKGTRRFGAIQHFAIHFR